MSIYESSWKKKANDFLEEAKEQNRVREMKEQKFVSIAKENYNAAYSHALKTLPEHGKKEIKDRIISRHERIGEIGHVASKRAVSGLSGLFKGIAKSSKYSGGKRK